MPRLGVASLEQVALARLQLCLADTCWVVAAKYRGLEFDEIVREGTEI